MKKEKSKRQLLGLLLVLLFKEQLQAIFATVKVHRKLGLQVSWTRQFPKRYLHIYRDVFYFSPSLRPSKKNLPSASWIIRNWIYANHGTDSMGMNLKTIVKSSEAAQKAGAARRPPKAKWTQVGSVHTRASLASMLWKKARLKHEKQDGERQRWHGKGKNLTYSLGVNWHQFCSSRAMQTERRCSIQTIDINLEKIRAHSQDHHVDVSKKLKELFHTALKELDLWWVTWIWMQPVPMKHL